MLPTIAADRPVPRTRSAPVLAMVLALVLVGFTLTTAPIAGAQVDGGVTRAEAAALATEAVDDDAALASLRQVTSIDGVPVDLDAVMAGIDDTNREVRLEALSLELGGAAAPAGGVTPDEARSQAESVLDDSKFSPPGVPRPFRGILEWVADRFEWIGNLLSDIYEPIGRFFDGIPGGRFIQLALLFGAVAAVVVALARRRSRTAVSRAVAAGLVDLRLDPDHLDAQAADMESSGELATAVRLRYEAGLLRLHRAERIVLRPDTTASGAAEQVSDPAMDQLTTDFQEIVYGGRAATDIDVERSRSLWPAVAGTRSRA